MNQTLGVFLLSTVFLASIILYYKSRAPLNGDWILLFEYSVFHSQSPQNMS